MMRQRKAKKRAYNSHIVRAKENFKLIKVLFNRYMVTVDEYYSCHTDNQLLQRSSFSNWHHPFCSRYVFKKGKHSDCYRQW